MDFLDKIRVPQRSNTTKRQTIFTIGIFLLGICMGTFSKYLDDEQGHLPVLLQAIDNALDFHNFLGGFAPWIVIAVCIAVYSPTPFRAAMNVFLFFVGFVASYYLYCKFVAGFFPRSYAMIWIAYTIVSPFLGFICWYAKGKGWVALVLSAGILGVLVNTAFAYGMFYIDISSGLNLFMWLLGILVLRKSVQETICMLGISLVFAPIIKTFVPFLLW